MVKAATASAGTMVRVPRALITSTISPERTASSSTSCVTSSTRAFSETTGESFAFRIPAAPTAADS